jgi:ferritin-like metal-binding protein YciE
MDMTNETLRSEFVTGLRNAHGLEAQAATLIDRQLERLTNYPQMSDELRRHRAETQQQKARLDKILSQYDASTSAIKEAAMSFMGNMAAITHSMADDEILKNTFANLAFENFEIASYKSLIAMARRIGDQSAVAILQETLREEQRMATWIEQNVEHVTDRYLELKISGQKADR